MTCPTCSNDMVKAKATDFGEEYDYCRTCKKELKEMAKAADNEFNGSHIPTWQQCSDGGHVFIVGTGACARYGCGDTLPNYANYGHKCQGYASPFRS